MQNGGEEGTKTTREGEKEVWEKWNGGNKGKHIKTS